MKKMAILILCVLLVACARFVEGEPTFETGISETPLNTFSFTFTPTSTVKPSISPTATQTPVFIYPTDWPMAVGTLTPIPTPGSPYAEYKLRNLNEQDFIDLIGIMDQYARDYDISGPSLSRPYYTYKQRPIELLLEETTARFPASKNTDAYKWHLAVTRAIHGDNSSDSWIMSSIENALQNNVVTVDLLNQYLIPNGFFATSQKAQNLFGDKQTSWILQISVNAGNKRDGLFFVVKQTDGQNYTTYPLDSHWMYTNSYMEIIGAADHNQNDLDEVELKIGSHSGTMCGSRMEFFEWNGDRFVDLTRGRIGYDHCGGSFAVDLDPLTGMSFFRVGYPYGYDPSLSAIFRWDGKYFSFAKVVGPTPWISWKESMKRGGMDYAEEADLLTQILNSDEIYGKGDGYPDYLQYRLGIAHALQSKREEAIFDFQKLINSPLDETRSLYPRMAKMFIELYRDDATLYRACLATNRLHDQIVGKGENFIEYRTRRREIEGIDLEGFDLEYLTPLCKLEDAFQVALASLPPDTQNLIGSLDQAGIEIQVFSHADLNQDGSEEWLINLEQGIWVLVYQENGTYHVANVLGAPWVFKNVLTIDDAKTIQVKGLSAPINIIQTENDLLVFMFSENNEWVYLSGWFNVKNYEIMSIGETVALVIGSKHRESPEYLSWAGYRWNQETQSFSDDLLEYLLFTEKRPDFALKLIKEVVPSYPQFGGPAGHASDDTPRFYYIAALAEELSGNESRAVYIYWQLWSDYPGSPYALMANRKLELRSTLTQ